MRRSRFAENEKKVDGKSADPTTPSDRVSPISAKFTHLVLHVKNSETLPYHDQSWGLKLEWCVSIKPEWRKQWIQRTATLVGAVNPDKEVEHFEFRLGRIYQIRADRQREDVFLHCHTSFSHRALTRSLAPHNSNWMMICC